MKRYLRLLLPLGAVLLLFSCATGGPQGGQTGAGGIETVPVGEDGAVPLDALDPEWEENTLRVREYAFALPPGWSAEILEQDEEWLLLSLLGNAGESGTLELFAGALGESRAVAERFVELSAAGSRAERSELIIPSLSNGERREVTLWYTNESEEVGRWVFFGTLSAGVGAPASAYVLQGRSDPGEWRLAPWPATILGTMRYEYLPGDLRRSRQSPTFYGGERWAWLGDTPGGVVVRRLPPGLATTVTVAPLHSRAQGRLSRQGLAFDAPRWVEEIWIGGEVREVPFLAPDSEDGLFLLGRLDEDLYLTALPEEPATAAEELEPLLPEVAQLLEGHLFFGEEKP